MRSVNEIKEILQSPEGSKKIKSATEYESRIRLHTEVRTDELITSGNMGVTAFLNWVKASGLPSEKYNIFLNLFRTPADTVPITSDIFRQLSRVFDGRNPKRDYYFNSDRASKHWEDILGRMFFSNWKQKSWAHFVSRPCSVLFVDLPEVQEGQFPEPYFYFSDIEDIVGYKLDDKGGFDYVIRKEKDNEQEFYYYFDKDVIVKAENVDGEYDFVIDPREHGLDYTPARFFINESINTRERHKKIHPTSSQLSRLDHLLKFSISKKHLDGYAGYPIYASYNADCDYESKFEQLGHVSCQGGYLKTTDGIYVMKGGSAYPCPVCSERKLTGAGSRISVDPPNEKGDPDLMQNAVKIITIDKNALDYNVTEAERLKGEIYMGVLGEGAEPVRDQAINVKQVMAGFEFKQQTLNYWKVFFEDAERWVAKTICSLAYGSGFKDYECDYGNKHFLGEASELLSYYLKSKEEGADDIILDDLYMQYIETKYREEPSSEKRAKLLSEIEPLRHLSKKEVLEHYKASAIDFREYQLKMNFTNLIARFERENGKVLVFGENLERAVRIDRIREALYKYVDEVQRPTVVV